MSTSAPARNAIQRGSREDRLVRIFQYAIACTPVVFIGGIIGWVTHLIRTSLRLRDVPSGAIGISLVAIPVFITLMCVLLYVLWGILRDRSER
jgi:cobalamin biosynthesis protein CobD/CbiB